MSGSVTSSKKRSLLGGLIRSRTPERQRHPLPPPSHPRPLSETRSPPQIQNVPLPQNTQYELRQKLQEAQRVEAFLTQANNFKPTIGGSDIEFLFNHIATPTAQRVGQVLPQKGIKELKKGARGSDPRQSTGSHNGSHSVADRSLVMTNSIQSIPAVMPATNLQSPRQPPLPLGHPLHTQSTPSTP